MRTHSICWLALPALIQACGAVQDDEEWETEPEDLAESTEAVISCTPRAGVGYRGGVRRDITLVDVDGEPVAINTANAFSRMRDAAARAGVQIRINSGFRTNEEQTRLYSCYTHCNCNGCNLAARPGYSNHQSGTALDLNTSRSGVLSWLNRNGSRYGFSRTVSSEPWHWEYSGGIVNEPCRRTASATPPTTSNGASALEITAPRAGGHYPNGVWFKAKTNGAVHHVRYDADGYVFGASEDAEAEFAYKRVFNTLGQHLITVTGYDSSDKEVAKKSITVYVDAGEARQPELTFVDLEDGQAYRNGFAFMVQPVPGATKVAYTAGPYGLGVSEDASRGFPVDVVFREYGARTIIAAALDSSGKVVAQRAITLFIVPGTEEGITPAVRFLQPLAGDRYGREELELTAYGTTSVKRVVYYAEGVEIGASSDPEGFPISRQFWQVGRRSLRVIGFNAAGAVVAEHTVQITIQ
ncbi:MAG: D-alanyl-D-alanine carboxypeptidase family protein [Deltaproteobacteria bacterium]|nr:D-alanyl-D-alanine carboxypeptidase family protein [Deltaproteobacteria bacterium]